MPRRDTNDVEQRFNMSTSTCLLLNIFKNESSDGTFDKKGLVDF